MSVPQVYPHRHGRGPCEACGKEGRVTRPTWLRDQVKVASGPHSNRSFVVMPRIMRLCARCRHEAQVGEMAGRATRQRGVSRQAFNWKHRRGSAAPSQRVIRPTPEPPVVTPPRKPEPPPRRPGWWARLVMRVRGWFGW